MTDAVPRWRCACRAVFVTALLTPSLGLPRSEAAPQRPDQATQPAPEAVALGEVRIDRPLGVLFLPGGSLLVAAAEEGVLEIDPESLKRRRTLVAGAPERSPVALAGLPDGGFLLLDELGPRIERFSAEGLPLPLPPQVESPLAEYLGLRRPRSIAVTQDGARLAVADTGNDRVLLLELRLMSGAVAATAPGGAPAAAAEGAEAAAVAPIVIGGRGGEAGRFRAPSGVAFDPAGRLFVADADNHRIQRFGRDGRFEIAFGMRGAMPGQLERPLALLSSGDSLLVVDHLNHRVQRISEDGDFRSLWGMHAVVPRQGGGRIHYPVAIAEDSRRGRFAVAEPFERRVQLFRRSAEGERVPLQPPLPFREGVSSHFGEGLSVDGALLAAWEPESAAVVLFDLRGERPLHVTTFGSPGRRPQEIGRLIALEVDEALQRLWLLDVGNDRLVEWMLQREPEAEVRFDPFMARVTRVVGFDTLGREVSEIDGGPVMIDPIAMARAPGELLLLDSLRGRVVRIDDRTLAPTEVLLRADMGFPRDPVALSVDPRGERVVVLDGRDPQRLAAILPLAANGSTRVVARPPDLSHPQSIAWLDEERLVVTTSDDRFFIVRLDGSVIASPSLHGVEDGRLWHPRGVRRAGDGSFFLVDWGNHRLQRFDSDGTWLARFGIGRSALRPRMPDAVPSVIRPRVGDRRSAPRTPTSEKGPFPRALVGPDGSPLRWWPVDEEGRPLAEIPLRDPFFVRIAPPEALRDATVAVDAAMPHHGHGMNLKPVTRQPETGGERIAGPLLFHMPGAWEIYFDLAQGGRLGRWQDEVIMGEGG